VPDLDEFKTLVKETLEAMIAHGDFLEYNEISENPRRGTGPLLYTAPVSFVARESGAAILLGVAPDQLFPLPNELEVRIEYVNHVRRLKPLPNEDLHSELIQLGLVEVSYDGWLKAPPFEDSAKHVLYFDRLMDGAQPSREVPGLSLLDPQSPVRFYPGRWVQPRSQTGRFVGRRRQAYGADLWCYVQIRNGHPERLIDLPLASNQWRGCDEAWWLQMAIDVQRGEPQLFRIRPGPGRTVVMELFSPVPMWATKRWDAVGEPIPTSGCLLAYRLPDTEAEEEIQFARKALWLDELR
jgi:hypothetical protein